MSIDSRVKKLEHQHGINTNKTRLVYIVNGMVDHTDEDAEQLERWRRLHGCDPDEIMPIELVAMTKPRA